MKEWEKHLEIAGEKLESANLLFEGDMFADAISEAYYAMFYASKALLALRDIFSKDTCGCGLSVRLAVCQQRSY